MSGFARHRRSKLIIANFTGFEADLLRSLAAQLVELLRNEAAAPAEHQDPFEAMLDFSGPTSEPEDPVLARLFPTAFPRTRRPRRSSAGSPRGPCATARPTRPAPSSTASRMRGSRRS